MSEPEAGSDFAGLRTRAERDGDVFRVNGHKIWTTQAHQSRWCTLYARTDPDAPKHRGISCLILDLHSPGVRIEPIRMASISDETFCEVFLDDVEVPAENLLGPLQRRLERRAVVAAARAPDDLDHELGRDQARSRLDARRLRRAAGLDIYTELGIAAGRRRSAAGHRIPRAGQRTRRTAQPGSRHPEACSDRLPCNEFGNSSAAAAGPRSAGDPDLLFERQDALAATIYGGTSEVQRNIIAERLLGLPKG